MGSAKISPSAMTTKPTSAIKIEVWTARLTMFWSLRPIALAMTTLEPSDMPINRLSIRLVSGTLEPTAAMARVPWSPEKLPIMTVAMRFDSCSKMLVAATGKANRGILRHSEPVVMSMCLDAVPAIRSQSLICSFVLICADDDTPNAASRHLGTFLFCRQLGTLLVSSMTRWGRRATMVGVVLFALRSCHVVVSRLP